MNLTQTLIANVTAFYNDNLQSDGTITIPTLDNDSGNLLLTTMQICRGYVPPKMGVQVDNIIAALEASLGLNITVINPNIGAQIAKYKTASAAKKANVSGNKQQVKSKK